MALRWRFWRSAAGSAPAGPVAAGVGLVVTGSVGGDLVVGDNNFLLHVHAAPAGKPVRLRVVDARPAAAVDLQDRPDIADRLAELSAGDTALACALVGGRGVGKTQLAAQYSRRRDDEGWEVVAWLPAESENALIAGWAQLAALIEPSDEPVEAATAARWAIAWLDAQPVRALIVYDNAADPDVIGRWRPTGDHVEVLVTTNDRRFRGMGVLIDVGVFAEEQAVAYLAARSGLADPDGAALLATELGCLPLALAQAGALIGTDRRYRGYEVYRQRLAGIDVAAMLPRTPGDPYPRGLAEATLLAVGELDEEHRQLLDVLAMLSPDGVDTVLLAELAPDDPDAVEDRLQDLVDRSLATRSGDGEYVFVHRTVRRVLQESALVEGEFAELIVRCTLTLLRAMSYEQPLQWPLRDRFWNLGMQIVALHESIVAMLGNETGLQPELLEALTGLMAWLAWHLNQVDQPLNAIALGEHVVAEQAAIYEVDDPELLPARNNLARAYEDAGRLDDAIDLYERNLDDHRRILGPDHEYTFIVRGNLGGAYRAAGRLDEALAMLGDLVADRSRILGPDHPDTLSARTALGSALARAGRLDEAIPVLETSLADHLRTVGPDAAGTLHARHALAAALATGGRTAPAVFQFEVNLDALERTFGVDHPDTISGRVGLARAYKDSGRADLAIQLLDTNLNHIMQEGPDHPHTMIAGNELALAYLAAGHVEVAVTMFEQVIEHAREQLGDDDPMLVTLRENLDLALRERSAADGSTPESDRDDG